MAKEIFAENVNYWKTGRSGTDRWLKMAKDEIKAVGGQILGEMQGGDYSGRYAFMLYFSIAGDQFKLVWPVLKSKSGNDQAARIQAATALYHDVKAKCVALKFRGARAAFAGEQLLPDGRTVAEVTNPELVEALPQMVSGAPRWLVASQKDPESA